MRIVGIGNVKKVLGDIASVTPLDGIVVRELGR